MAKAVNGLITPHTERCGIKAIQCDLVLSRVIHNAHTATALFEELIVFRESNYRSPPNM